MNLRAILFLISSLLFFLSSCSDDKEIPFDADDNFIISLTLTKNDVIYTAVIQDNDIIVTVPYTIDLNNATAFMEYTSSANIIPDPATITNWGNDMVFRVTSYNGDANEYTYSVIKTEIESQGDVILATQENVAAFEETKITVINGNLIIGSNEENATPITDLSPLNAIKEVEGQVVILNSFDGSDIDGLDMNKIGGLVVGNEGNTYSNENLYRLRFKNLQTINGDVSVYCDAIQFIEFDNLRSITGKCIFNIPKTTVFQFPMLETTESDFECLDVSSMTQFELPIVTKIGGKLSILKTTKLESIKLPNLYEAGSINFDHLGYELSTLSMPNITVVNGDLFLLSDWNGVEGSGYDWLGNSKLEKIDGLDKLTTVKGVLTLGQFSGLSEMPDFENLTLVGGVKVFSLDKFGPSVGVLNLGNADFQKFNDVQPMLTIGANAAQFQEVITKEDLSGVDVTFNLQTVSGSEEGYKPKLYFKKVRSIYFRVSTNANYPVQLNIESVEDDFKYEVRNSTKYTFSLPELKSVGGYMSMLLGTNIQAVECPKLESVGGQLIIPVGIGTPKTFDFSSLKYVCCADNPHYSKQGESTYYRYGSLHMIVRSYPLEFPSLEKVGGDGITVSQVAALNCPKLTAITDRLTCYNTGAKFTEFNLPSLITLRSAYLSSMKVSDFSVFGPMIQDGQITEENWSVKNCGYNPTYQDMKEGRYKPEE